MFGRRRPPAALPDDGTEARANVTSIVGLPIDRPPATVDGTTGWAPFGDGHQHPSQQIGAFAGTLLNAYPALVNDAQKKNGVSGLDSSWYIPTRTYVSDPTRSTQRTAITPGPANPVGGQRYGLQFSGLVGPISARLLRGRVTAAAVRQTKIVGDVSDLVTSWQPAPSPQTGE